MHGTSSMSQVVINTILYKHISDLPILVSGTDIGILDPQERLWPGDTGRRFELRELQGSSITSTLHGIAKFDKDSPNYLYTIFRLPLRSRVSNLSKNIYSVEKLKQLLGALRLEAKYLLLFLKSVTKIEVIYIDKHSGSHEQTFCVSIDTNLLQINSERSRLLTQLHQVHTANSCHVSNIIQSKVSFKITVTETGQSNTSEWVVVTRVGSDRKEVLQRADELRIFPWVGTAIELTAAQVDDGRVFCFLPLPSEVTSGLPVHVNGTFSLNDERRTLKWTSAERTNDTMAMWNDHLIANLLPGCYFELLLLVKDTYHHKQFYRSWPDPTKLQRHWSGVLENLYRKLFNVKCFWSAASSCWVGIQDAVFVQQEEELSSVVIRVLARCDVKVVQAPNIVWKALGLFKIKVQTVTPHLTRDKIQKKLTAYESESAEDKLRLLQYCLSDKKFSDLYRICLVPLANGKFTFFTPNGSSESLYICNTEYPRSLIPNQDNLLINVPIAMLQNILIELARSEQTQLKVLNTKRVAALLPASFPRHWKGQSVVTLPCRGFPTEWFETFWNWVQSHQLSHFKGLLVLPISTKSIRDGFRVTVLKEARQSSVLLVTDDCPNEMLTALDKLRVNCTMIRHTPYVKHPELQQYVNKAKHPGQILASINNATANARIKINDVSFSEGEAVNLQRFLSNTGTSLLSLTKAELYVLEQLSIFKTLNSSRLISIVTSASTSWGKKATLEPHGFQLTSSSLPDTLLIFSRSENCTSLFSYFSNVIDKPNTMAELIQTKVFGMITAACIPSSKLTSLMKEIIQLLPVLKMQVLNGRIITDSISKLPFLPTLSGQRKAPADLFDPLNKQIQTLFQDMDVFPLSPFNERAYIVPLQECGLQTTVSAQQLLRLFISTSTAVSKVPVKVDEKVFKRVQAIMEYISSFPNLLSQSVNYADLCPHLDQAIRMICSQRSCLPVLKQAPSYYPQALTWKGASSVSRLVAMLPNVICCTNAMLAEYSYLAGSEAYIVEIPHVLRSVLSIQSLNVNMVLDHFKQVLTLSKHLDGEDLDKHFKPLVYQVYTFLNDNLKQCVQAKQSNGFLYSEEWIWLSKRKKFIKPQFLASQEHPNFSETQLEPYLYVLPEELQQYANLFQSFGVEEKFSNSQIISVLTTIRKSSSQTVSPKKQWSVVTGILEWITDGGKTSVSSKLSPLLTLYVPITTEPERPYPVLENVEAVVYTDLKYLRSFYIAKDEEYKFIHERVAHMADALGAKGLSKQLNISDDTFGDVGPHEPIVTRLKNILKDYQDGLTIIKELLQNADDAEATEVNICYDARSHPADPSTLLYRGMADCHGPALVVHNNGVFSNDDFINIEKLAGATKEHQHLKIGKFGLGFCSVYHLTDIPSFISRDRLYIFDPTLEYLREENQDQSRPGKRLQILKKIVARSKQLDPYIGLFGFEHGKPYEGTLFRFPFRTEVSELSKIKYRGSHVRQLISDIQEAGSKLLLFLRHVNHITFSQIEKGQSKPTVLLDICRETKKTLTSIGDSMSKSSETVKLLSITVAENEEKPVEPERWLVATCSISGNDKYGVSSVACSLQSSVPTPVKGEMFCFLPLSIETGLPVHVSSNFAVKNDRSGIHASDDQRKSSEANWNITLMKFVIPEAYCSLLVAVQGLCEDKTVSANDYTFTSLWPLSRDLRINNPWVCMVQPTYKLIMKNKLFYSSNREKWLMFEEIKVLSHSILCFAHNHTLPKCVITVMESLKYNLVTLPTVYQKCLPITDNSYIISEEEFLKVFFVNFNKLSISLETRNEILHLLLLKFAATLSSSQKSDFQYLRSYFMHYRCIPCKPDGKTVRFCSDVVDPHAYFAILYDEEDGVFPVDSDNEIAHAAMKRLGMISQSLPWKMVIERAQTIKKVYSKSKEKTLQKIGVILQCVGSNVKQTDGHLPSEESELLTIPFLPVMGPPENYPDFLFWQGKSKNLLTCQEALCGEGNHKLAGSQEAIICEKPFMYGGCGIVSYSLRSALGIRSNPTFSAAVKHLCYIASKCIKLKDQRKLQAAQKWIDESTSDIFNFFETELGKKSKTFEPNDLKKLQEVKCIWTGKEFVPLQCVAVRWNINGPFLFKLPDVLQRKKNLIKELRIQERFTVDHLLATLKELYDSCGTVCLEEREMKLIEGIVSELDQLVPDSGLQGRACYLPDEQLILREVGMLIYNDAQWCKIESECFIVHYTISRKVAQKLGVKLVRAKALESYESSEQYIEGVEFGQHEELTQRINNILNEYPFDITVIKELLQNADDARAEKLYFILDKRNHSYNKVLSDSWKDLQGPAVLVWNDTGFSPNDLEGIQKLGLGSKRSKSESIGQYGIGFNVVYHLTDCPSFITNGNTFCVLDPHIRYVSGASERRPGRMYVNLDGNFWNNYRDLKAPYLRDELTGCPTEIVTSGSLFRFPLRHRMELVLKSKLLGDDYKNSSFLPDYPLLTANRMERYLDDWAPKMKDALLFLNNVVDLKFFVIEENSRVSLRFHFTAGLGKEALSKRLAIQNRAKQFTAESAKTPTSEFYSLQLSEEVPNKKSEKWLVKRGIGDSMKHDQHWEFLHCIRPNHGLATPVGRKDFKGNVFCFLPLPMFSHLPVHVNGSFILDAARSGMWQARDLRALDDKTRWNNYLVEAIASTYSDFIVTCQSFYVENSYPGIAKIYSDCQSYYGVFPRWSHRESYSYQARSHSQSRDASKETGVREKRKGSSSTGKWQEPVLEPDEEEDDDKPVGVMSTLAKLMYKKLFQKNTKVHVVIKQKETTAEEESSQLPCLAEWHPLINSKEPSKQVYFWMGRHVDKITQILKRMGMHLSAAPIWIRKHFRQVKHDLPEAIPSTVFVYYKQFFSQVTCGGKFPCPIKDTTFDRIEDFKTFSKYILFEKEGEMEFPESPWGLPLLVTADNQLTPFSEISKVIHTSKDYSTIFSSSLNCFLHQSLLDITYNKSYFLEPSKKNWKTVQRILQSAIPRSLQNVHIVKEAAKVFSTNNFKLMWECLTTEEIFSEHLGEILKEFALLLSTDGQSFSCKTSDQLLPVIRPQNALGGSFNFSLPAHSHWTDPLQYKIYELLSKHSMPVLDTSICDIEQSRKFCPEFSSCRSILNNMYHLYKLIGPGTLYTQSVLNENVKKLFLYFAKIHYRDDKVSLTRVKALPLFRDISGCYKTLEREACIWPRAACMVGSDKWLNEQTTVFLPTDGDWRELAPAAVLHINDISPLQLYTKFIFPSFQKFSQDERINHLKHIRDTQELFETAYAVSNSQALLSEEADLFVAALKQLPCLPINGSLKPLVEFCDPKSKIFKLFPEDVHFPPEDLQDEKWLIFFRKIGMRTNPSTKEFFSYCKKIADGKHRDILAASKALVEHLCSTEEWHDKEDFLLEISKVPFVGVQRVQRLRWIKEPCPPTNIVQLGKRKIYLTTLRGSVVSNSRNPKIAWTVRCLVELPRLHQYRMTTKKREAEKANSFLDNIGVSLEPSPEDVVTNLCNISHTKFADFGLFHKYQDKLIAKKHDFPLVDVIQEHFLYLQKVNESATLMSRLRDVPCIPVSQEGKVMDFVKPVLVKPVGVVASDIDDLKCFIPYLNPLPFAFFDVSSQLTAIGVSRHVQLEQVQFALDTIKKHIQDPYDPNTITKLKELLKLLYSLLPNKVSSKQISRLKCPLYLPNKQGVLVDTKTLLFDDLGLLRNTPFDLSQVSFSFLLLLVKHEDELNEYGFTVEDLHIKLPEHVQPRSLSKCSTVVLHEQCRPNNEEQQSDFVVKLRKSFSFPQFAEVVSMVLSQKQVSEKDTEQFLKHLDLFLNNLQVFTVKDLKVNISLTLADPPVIIGTASTDFHFQEEPDGPDSILYVEESISPLKLGLFEAISLRVSQHVLKMSSSALKETEKIIGTLIRAENAQQIQEYLSGLRINTSNLQLEESGDIFRKPKVGETVPESWHEWLRCDVNNYFRPQELAALEVGEEKYIYVIVEYKLQSTGVVTQASEESGDEEEREFKPDRYQIRISEKEDDTKIVSVVELRKLLCIKTIKQDDDTTEIVIYDSESASVKMWDSVKGDKLKDIMKDICSDLRRIWTIKDKDEKRKAIKAMYLKWHPDKNSHPLATKAFQFLKQQIARLEQGLPLEDPSDDWEQDTSYSCSSNSFYDFSWWDEIIRNRSHTWQQERRRHRSRGRRGRRGGGSGGGGGGGGLSSAANDWTRSILVNPEPTKARVWFEQAEYDQRVMKAVLENVSSEENPQPRYSAHVCYLACQVAEKAIKAGMYQVCGFQSDEQTHHKFVGYAGALEQERGTQASGLQGLARTLEDYYDKSRYPNAFSPHTAPSTLDYFGPSRAREAEMAASQIFEIIRKIVFE